MLARSVGPKDSLHQNSRNLWRGIVVLFVIGEASLIATGLRIDFKSNPTVFILSAGFVGFIWFYRRIRPDERLAEALTAVAQLVLILCLGLILSYAAAAVAMPYRDAELYAIDRWLGFDRPTYVNFFTNQPWKTHLTDLVYLSMLPEMAIIPFVLIMTSQIERLQRFIAAFGIALIATVGMFVLVPAVGAFVYVDLTPSQYAALPADIYTPARNLDALRSGLMKMIPLNNLEGLIAFPSFHTAAAILYAWALWSVKTVRWIIILFNVAIIATTPISGSHYIIDVVAGVVVTLAAIAASRRLCEGESGSNRAEPDLDQSPLTNNA